MLPVQLTFEDNEKLNALYNALRVKKDLTFYVTEGREGERLTYVGKVPMDTLIEGFPRVPQDIDMPSHIMIQRDLDHSRANGVANYVKDNTAVFIFPGLMAIVEDFTLTPVVGNVYALTIPAESFRYLVDGQGRRGGIEILMQSKFDDIDLSEQHFDVKFIRSMGATKDNQICVDINTSSKAFNQSQKAAMDSRKVVSVFSRELSQQSPLMGNVSYTKASVTSSSESPYLWTLNQIGAFILKLTGTTKATAQDLLEKPEDRAYIAGFTSKFFSELCRNPTFGRAMNKDMSAPDVREKTVIGTATFFKSLAIVAKVVKMNLEAKGPGKADWGLLDKWSTIDLTHNNKEWVGRCKNFRGGYEDRPWNHKAVASYLLKEMNIPAPPELDDIEREVKMFREQWKQEAKEG